MSLALDLSMRREMLARLLLFGTGPVGTPERVVDFTDLGIAGLTSANIQLSGEGSELPKDITMEWVEGTLVKTPQIVITKGLSHKKGHFVVFIKTRKAKGVQFNEALSGKLEEHFENNLHLGQGLSLVTIIKTYQQPSIFLDSASGRYWNRVFIEIEAYTRNNPIGA